MQSKKLPENLADLERACKAPAKHKRMQRWKPEKDLICSKCGKAWGTKTVDGFTILYPVRLPYCQCSNAPVDEAYAYNPTKVT